MEKYIRKYFWTVNLVTIAICSYLLAKSVNTFLGASLAEAEGAVEVPIERSIEEKKPDNNLLSSERKATKNPFTGELLQPPPPPPGDEPEEPQPDLTAENPDQFTSDTACPKTSLEGELVGTMASSNPKHGFAIFETNEKSIKMIEVGQEVQAGVRVVAVVRHKVFLNNGGRIECFYHGEVDEKKTEARAVAEPAAEGEGIRKVSETEYIIAQSEVAKAMENLNALATQARIVPSFKNGQSNGFRIYSIKPGSLYQKIGIKNGDIIQRINGMDINSPEKALEIYSKLRTEKSLSIDLLRRGQKTTMDYAIQ